MGFRKLLLVLCIAGAAVHFWNERDAKAFLETENISANGFVALPAPTNLDTDTVIVLAAEGCPKEDAQRADQLAEELGRLSIRYTRAHSVNFDLPNSDLLVLKLLDLVMNGPLPVVFVNGKGKANPSLQEVLAEYGTSTK